jgi:hypothetical protein
VPTYYTNFSEQTSSLKLMSTAVTSTCIQHCSMGTHPEGI